MISPEHIGVKKIVQFREASIPTKVDPTKVDIHENIDPCFEGARLPVAPQSPRVSDSPCPLSAPSTSPLPKALSFRRASEARQEEPAVRQQRIRRGCPILAALPQQEVTITLKRLGWGF
jgi:hypothetical protein